MVQDRAPDSVRERQWTNRVLLKHIMGLLTPDERTILFRGLERGDHYGSGEDNREALAVLMPARRQKMLAI